MRRAARTCLARVQRPPHPHRLPPSKPIAVDDIDAGVASLRARGAELVGEVECYEDSYRLCYVRGPERSSSSWRSRSTEGSGWPAANRLASVSGRPWTVATTRPQLQRPSVADRLVGTRRPFV
jgi:hypothetical protein